METRSKIGGVAPPEGERRDTEARRLADEMSEGMLEAFAIKPGARTGRRQSAYTYLGAKAKLEELEGGRYLAGQVPLVSYALAPAKGWSASDVLSVRGLLGESVEILASPHPALGLRLAMIGATIRGERSFALEPVTHVYEQLAEIVGPARLHTDQSFREGQTSARARAPKVAAELRRPATVSYAIEERKSAEMRAASSPRLADAEAGTADDLIAGVVAYSPKSGSILLRVVTRVVDGDAIFGPGGAHHVYAPRGVIHRPPMRPDQAIGWLWHCKERFGEGVGLADPARLRDELEAQVRRASIVCEVRGMPGRCDVIDGQLEGEPTRARRTSAAAGVRLAAERRRRGGSAAVSEQVADVGCMALAVPSLDEVLYEPQRRIVGAHLATGFGFLNASQVGTGKTCATARAWRAKARELPDLRVLLICQSELREQWREELAEKFFPEAALIAAEPPRIANQLARFERETGERPGVVIASYEQARMYTDELGALTYDEIVVDEAARLANPNTQLSRALWKLRKRAAVGIGLTGTPFGKSLGELDSIIAFCREDERALRERPLERHFGGFDSLTRKRLMEAMGPVVQRVTRAEMRRYMPEVGEIETVKLTPGDAHAALLERIETGIAEIYAKVVDQIEAAASKRPELAAAAKAELASTRGVLLGGVTVAQLAKDPEALRGSKARVAKLCESDGLLDAAIKEGSVSRRIVAQTIADSVTDDEQVLLFSQFTSHLRLIERELRREHGVEAALYTGDTPKRERHGVKRAFREGRSRVVLVGPIGEEGHNIQPAAEACVVVHYDLPWVATSFEQRTGRAARPGSGADQIAVLVPLLRRSIEMRVATILLPRAAKSIEALSREGELEPMAVQLEDVAGQLQAELGDREEASARLRVCQMIFAEHASKAKRGG